jgi:O-antigen/teichoic acid export membrane protein
LDAIFTVNALLAIGLTLLLLALSFATGLILGEPRAGSVLRVIALSNLLGIISFRSAAMLQRHMQFKRLSIITLSTGVAQTAATIAFALAGATYLSPAYASLVSGLVGTGLTVAFGRQYVSFRVSLSGWRQITAFGLQMMSVSGVATLTGRLSDLILGRLLGVAALGLYSRASSLSSMIFDNLYGTATRVVFVQLSKDYREGGAWRTTYLNSFAMITAFMWPLLIGLAVLSGPVIFTLYGERWLPAALPLSALMIAQFVGIAFGMNWELFVLRGETGRQARYEVTRMLVGVPMFAAGCLISLFGAAVAKIAEALVGFVVYYPHVRRLAEIGPRELPTIYRDSAALTLVAVSPALALMVRYDWSARTPWPLVTGAVLAGVALWFALLALIGHPLHDEIKILWRRMWRERVIS